MKHYRNMTALAFGVLAGTAIFAGGKTVAADTLDTEIAGAGIAVALNDYTAGVATEAETQATDISTLIPQQSNKFGEYILKHFQFLITDIIE